MKCVMMCLFVFMVTSTGLPLSAQHFMIKGGVNLSNLSEFRNTPNTPLVMTDQQINFHVETSVEFQFTERYSAQGGLKYSGRGHSFEYLHIGEFFWNDESVTSRMHYLDIPLALKASFQGGTCETYLFAGGYLGIGLHGKDYRTTVTRNGIVEKSEVNAFDADGPFKRLDYGAIGGAGMYFGPVFLEFSYSMGLTDIGRETYLDKNTYNRLLSISLGYRLN